jgi:hypothetical protein
MEWVWEVAVGSMGITVLVNSSRLRGTANALHVWHDFFETTPL